MSRILPLATVALLSLGLVACSTNTESNAPDFSGAEDCETYALNFTTGDTELCGVFGQPDTASFQSPITVETTSFQTVIQGEGEALADGDNAIIAFSLYNASTGEALSNASLIGEVPVEYMTLDSSSFMSGIVAALNGAQAGSRIVAVIPPEEGYGAEGNVQFGLAETDNLLWVIDVLSQMDDRASGAPQEPPVDLPAVSLDTVGRPTITIPAQDPSGELDIAVLQQGDGEVVQDGATVWVHYQGTNWRTGEIFDESWGSGIASFSLSSVVAGFSQAIAGQSVGSQVIAVIPPDFGYGPNGGNDRAGIAVDDTIVFVIDILAVRNPS